MDNKLQEARAIINEVDEQMASLFVQRMKAAEMVYEYKKAFGLPVLDTKREAVVIERNAAFVEDELIKGYYIDHLKHMMSLSRAYQYRLQNGLKVAYSGVEGAFAHIAAERIFPDSNRIACRDFKAAYDAVLDGECDVAVLPIENSYAGEVGQTIDLIFSGTLYINGIYELQDNSNESITRFAVLSKVRAESPALSNSVLMFTVKHEAGSLATAISMIDKYGYNMTALRSRPLRKHSWQYYFYIEIDGTTNTEKGRQMLDELDKVCDQLKVAGTFAPHTEL